MLDAPCDRDLIMKSWGYITHKSFGDMVLKVKLDINRNQDFEKAVKIHLDSLGLVDIVQSNPDLIIEVNNKFTAARGNNALQIISAHEVEVFRAVLSENDVEGDLRKIDLALISFAQARYLRNIEIVSKDSMKVKLEIIPIEVEQVGRAKSLKGRLNASNFIKDGILKLPEGQHLVFKLTNTSSSDCYFTIFDIEPNNNVRPVIPTKYTKPEEFKLEKGKSIELTDSDYIFKLSPPLGLDVLKIILTKKPMEFANLISTRGGENHKGPDKDSPLQTLLKSSYQINGKNRGADSNSIPPDVTIQSLPYYILAKPAN